MHFMQEYYLIDQQKELLGVVGPNDPDTLEIFPYVIGEVYRKLTVSHYIVCLFKFFFILLIYTHVCTQSCPSSI